MLPSSPRRAGGFLRKFTNAPPPNLISSPPFVIYGKVTKVLWKRIGLDFLLHSLPLHKSYVKYAFLGLQKFYGSPVCHFSTKWGRWLSPSSPKRVRLLPPEARKGLESFRWALVLKISIYTLILISSPPIFVFFDCFLSETSRNFTDSMTMGVVIP